ncbi:MAG: hypothetical protein PF692_12240, partial [Kiritimatiellae bacterium]|nr:hypothetical protein [Kiritimatiellia bacterium]
NLKAYVTSLKSGFKYWEIFNEPNLWRVSQGSDKGKRTMFPAKYFEFQKVAYKTIKGVNPDLQVVCNALNNVQFDWLDEWMKLGAVDYMDKFSFHPYGITDFYDQGEELKKVMKSFKFNGQLVNSEKYYGANLFYDRAAYEETRRGYYLPYNEELATAGRSVQHYISSVAVGVPVCFFNPTQTISRRGPGDELFVYDFFSAYSAAIRFMANAGSGSPIELGQVVGAYVFPDASGGPLVAIWSPLANIDARMKLKADCKVYDIMGNLYSADERKIGVRVARDPSYIRFAPGTSKDTIEQVLKSSDIVGLGSPFDITLAITGGNRIFAIVRSRRNTPLNGKIKLISVPKEWVTSDKEHEFASLLPGETRRIDFEFEQIEINPLEDYKVSALAELNEEEFTRVDSTLRPLFAFHVDNIKADGDLSDWKDIDSIKLGEANLSKEFNSKLKRTGDQDLSAEVALGWNADYFAMVVMVTDDKQQSGESPMTGWQGDSLQIYFDLKNDAMTTESNSGDDVEYLFSLISGKANAWLVKGADGNYKGKANKTDGFNDVDVDVSITRSGNKTIYEIVFPLSKCLPGVTLGNDLNFGFSLLINDNDGQGRKTGLTFAPKGTEPYGHPESYSDLILRKK